MDMATWPFLLNSTADMESYVMRQQLLKDRRHDNFLNSIEDIRKNKQQGHNAKPFKKIEAGHCDSPSPI